MPDYSYLPQSNKRRWTAFFIVISLLFLLLIPLNPVLSIIITCFALITSYFLSKHLFFPRKGVKPSLYYQPIEDNTNRLNTVNKDYEIFNIDLGHHNNNDYKQENGYPSSSATKAITNPIKFVLNIWKKNIDDTNHYHTTGDMKIYHKVSSGFSDTAPLSELMNYILKETHTDYSDHYIVGLKIDDEKIDFHSESDVNVKLTDITQEKYSRVEVTMMPYPS